MLSPEGFASILWKDASRHKEACELMKLTARDLKAAGVVDEIIPEPLGGAQEDPGKLYACMEMAIEKSLAELTLMSPEELKNQRIRKFREIGEI